MPENQKDKSPNTRACMRGYLLGQIVTHIHTCAHIYTREMLLPGCKKGTGTNHIHKETNL